jgi:hypothetical protein
MAITLGNCSNCCGGSGGAQEQSVFAAMRYTSIAFWFDYSGGLFPNGDIGRTIKGIGNRGASIPSQVYTRWDSKSYFNGQLYQWYWGQYDTTGAFTYAENNYPGILPGSTTSTTPPTPPTVNYEFDGTGQMTRILITQTYVEGVYIIDEQLSGVYTLQQASTAALALLNQVPLLKPAQYQLGTGQNVTFGYATQTAGPNLSTNVMVISLLVGGANCLSSPNFGIVGDSGIAGTGTYGQDMDYPGDLEYGTYTASAGMTHQTNNINPVFDGNIWVWKRAVRHLTAFTTVGDTLWVPAPSDQDIPPLAPGPGNGGLVKRAGQPRTNLNPPMLPGEDILDPFDIGQPGFRSWG